ncbi:uncharacterized protein EV422DRAFT_132235 [Fimicolochytrium jonesii]|uniref:uncharacterized protein n=1 Tax=Fimicolochytrium jonesii TaxID=1396493 RepID=UPI0022FEBA1E|nr:uncharacterized protein EV422DRAFT_132235 [Fimicolochytrium jonesii]KAI8825579.1 hypothetical protein EV422DRAFT_132235 [Fimicolochytrium jonesii]
MRNWRLAKGAQASGNPFRYSPRPGTLILDELLLCWSQRTLHSDLSIAKTTTNGFRFAAACWPLIAWTSFLKSHSLEHDVLVRASPTLPSAHCAVGVCRVHDCKLYIGEGTAARSLVACGGRLYAAFGSHEDGRLRDGSLSFWEPLSVPIYISSRSGGYVLGLVVGRSGRKNECCFLLSGEVSIRRTRLYAYVTRNAPVNSNDTVKTTRAFVGIEFD